jgi:cardiolipin synthase
LSSPISSDKTWGTVSNLLTLMRLALTPFIVLNMYYQHWISAFVLFVIAAGTDLLDGYLARALNQQTHLGALLDPIADKLLLLGSFGALAFFSSPFFHIPTWFFVLGLAREVILIVGVCALCLRQKRAKIEPLIWGKLTTLFQIVFLKWIFICYFMGWEPKRTYTCLLYLVAVFSVISLFQYVKKAVDLMR